MKTPLVVELVQRIVAEQFPQWAHLSIRPVPRSGWDNRTFRLGDEMLVRLPSAACYASQVEKEQRWLPWLARRVPLPIPKPLALGSPSEAYPWNWSVYEWLKGDSADVGVAVNLNQFAVDLASFLNAFQQVEAADGPPPGEHNFHRGGSLTVYADETHRAIHQLKSEIDASLATRVWRTALDAHWGASPVWVHGDVHATNLLVRDGRLAAVIDFGCCCVGDPACDLTIAWTFFHGDSRETFRKAMNVDEAAWARSRGWALWKALITVANRSEANSRKAASATRVIRDILAEA